MPRISRKTIREAFSFSPLLPPLLKATRTVELAKLELRWIQNELPKSKWAEAIARRSKLEPLQYILGSQPFGSLEILCQQNVLIPRWETEEWVTKTAEAYEVSSKSPISILDACTGSGCIPLLLKSLIPSAQVQAFDFSDAAIQLSLRNRKHSGIEVDFWKDDLFNFQALDRLPRVDLLTSNPPYIPENDYKKPLALNGPELSVRLYEPREALVGHLEFYEALIDKLILPLLSAGLIFELGYEDQVLRTAEKLPHDWLCGRYVDLANNLRCVVAWKRGSAMSFLRLLVNGGYIK
ncbi:modification methylase HemK [Metschnikowia bicuspidata var. bicuspidata NRRL YB-4993]|uniref:peptide chain release factor N(5)-glutamine methyltransferase n=1 Tax=Metschnikowia bicuspidata var. bicuspidata NRRL YB-4993 TaxID=869754 RepID=A0A1A0HI17_9ASCO|nr:modification methylase HemK [Metschnikowia bicuspidata var. bicuspidata NRRL YB-4993]OBA23646.1 modification methylase HemK [Metschnikowia bicuspidata var. bicuspidata NRRL YB-4993]